MSQFKIDITQKLASALPDVNVAPLYNDGVYPSALYSWRDGAREAFYKDSFGLAEAELTVSIFANSYSQMTEISNLVIADFHAFHGTIGQTKVLRSDVTNQFETTLNDGKLFQSIITIRIQM